MNTSLKSANNTRSKSPSGSVSPKSKATKLIAIAILAATTFPAVSYAQKCPNPANEVLVKAGRAILSGPTKKQLCINDHQFVNVKEATKVRGPDGKMVSMTGKMSHELRGRPDDQLYYTVNFVNGKADLKHVKLRIDRGGIAALVSVVSSSIESVLSVLTGVNVNLPSQDAARTATQVSRLVEGRGWEEQAKAMIGYAAVYAELPPAQLPAQLR